MSEQPAVQTAQTAAVPPPKPSLARRLLQVIMGYLWFIGTQFLAAGRLDWIRGWIAVALWALGMTAVGITVHHYNAGLLEQRAKWRRKDTKPFDKLFLALYVPLVMLQPAVAGLDAGRYHWSSMPFALVYPGTILLVLAMLLIGWVMCVNPYAETSVRIQTDRGHTVISAGPYRFVRHPMYVGAILMYLGTPLVWGSLWAMAVTAVIIVLMIWRTTLEDRTLRYELPGYEEFTAHTPYRLLPGVW